ncbi:MAG: chemotaxis protein CheW [Polyangia bacterium]
MKGPSQRQAPPTPEVEAASVQLVAFELAGGDYAIDIMRLKEVIQPLPVTVIPRGPTFLEGVIDLRGAILPVVDLRRRFGLPSGDGLRRKLLIVAVDVGLGPGRRLILGLVVDRVREPIRVPASELKPAPPLAHIDTDSRTFGAVATYDGRLHMVIDVDRLLGPRERAILAGRDFEPEPHRGAR